VGAVRSRIGHSKLSLIATPWSQGGLAVPPGRPTSRSFDLRVHPKPDEAP
jgi:hypothetical protein